MSARVFITLSVLFAAAPTGADVNVVLRAAWVDIVSEDEIRFEESDTSLPIRFTASAGPAVAVEFPIGAKLRGELSIARAEGSLETRGRRADGMLTPFGETLTFDLLPLTAAARYHPSMGRRLDPYVGGGVSATFVTDQTRRSLIPEDTDFIETNGLAPFANIGSNISLWRRLSLNVDAKYVFEERRMHGSRFALGRYDQRSAFNHLVAAAGVNVRF